MSSFGITSKGFIMRRLDEILSGVCAQTKEEVGVDPSENPHGIFNAIYTIICDKIAYLWECFAAGYQQLFPNTATGTALDNVMSIGGVTRIGQARTKYSLSCTGKEGTLIPAGALVQSSTYPTRQFQASESAKISSENWREIKFRPVDSISGTVEFTFSVTQNSNSGKVGTSATTADIAKTLTVTSYDDAYGQILELMQSFEALANLGITVSEQTGDGGKNSITLTSGVASGSFASEFCVSVTIVEVTSNLAFESVEYGSYPLADKTITKIVSTIDGWESVTNEISPQKGRLAQTDSEARRSYTKRVASRGTGTVAAIVSLLYSDVEGVTFATGYQNDDDEEDSDGRPPHCIEIVVQGGDDEDVADIIWKNKAGGIQTHGTYYAYATDANGTRQYVEFTRVVDTYLLLSVKVTGSDDLDDDYAARIKTLLLEETFTAGEKIQLQSFISKFQENITGLDYVEIYGLLSSTADITGVADDDMLKGVVPVSISQQPVLTETCIRVEKTT